jgi:hypothetical protein
MRRVGDFLFLPSINFKTLLTLKKLVTPFLRTFTRHEKQPQITANKQTRKKIVRHVAGTK